MTIKEARKILGSLATNLSDSEIEQDIKTAEILKNLFFSFQIKSNNTNGSYKINKDGKTTSGYLY